MTQRAGAGDGADRAGDDAGAGEQLGFCGVHFPTTPHVRFPDPRAGQLKAVADFDIDVLILSEHEAFRRSFTEIEALDDPAQVRGRWQELADQLEVHASGEEEVFYPLLLQQVEDSEGETKHAVHDHNEIREAVRAVDEHEPATDDWWAAFRNAREVTADHLGEEEREMLGPFKDSVDAETRNELGMRWLQFHEEHERAKGLSGDDTDPDQYVADNS